MINSRMWLVVNPTVGLPLLLGAVALGSFSVHVAITTNTTWVKDFLSGREMGSTDAAAAAATAALEGASITIDRSASGEAQSAEIVLEDGRVGKIVFEDTASADVADAAKPLTLASGDA
ncbi:MAG: light-harvesting protein [Pseudomonadota bacterium]